MAAAPTQRVSLGALAAAGGGALLIISLFLDWAGIGSFSVTGWQVFSLMDIVLFAIGVGSIVLAFLELPATGNVNLPFGRTRALTILGIVSTTIVWSTIFENDHLKFGIFLAGISSLGILAGGVLLERNPAAGVMLGGRAAAVAQGGPAAFQQPGGYQQQAAPAPAVSTPPTQQQPAAAAAPAAAQAPPNRPGQPADWYPDPQGLKRLRYWDGSQWTEHVAD